MPTVPKPPKSRDRKIIKQIRNEGELCELCGDMCGAIIEVAHVVSSGAGGPDIRENLLRLGGPASMQIGCHGNNHIGLVTQKQLLAVVAEREQLTIEECWRRIRRAMGYKV